jgi:uncharacterized protein YjbI with pentapeptide repeats
MANKEHLKILKEGVKVWNRWREDNPSIAPDLSHAKLRSALLNGINFEGAILNFADLTSADLYSANLSGAVIASAKLSAILDESDLRGAVIGDSNLTGASLGEANLTHAKLIRSNLCKAVLSGANLSYANFSKSDLSGATLDRTILVETDFTEATLKDCSIYGISAWNLRLENTKQYNLRVTRFEEPAITVDNIELAQFVYLLLNNENLRKVINTVTSKVVLIIGRFSPERKVVLDAVREELRYRNLLPVLFDFEKPEGKTYRDTLITLARMARFIIADITSPKIILQELEAIVPTIRVPIQPILQSSSEMFSTIEDFEIYPWFLKTYHYRNIQSLINQIGKKVVAPAEAKAKAMMLNNVK